MTLLWNTRGGSQSVTRPSGWRLLTVLGGALVGAAAIAQPAFAAGSAGTAASTVAVPVACSVPSLVSAVSAANASHGTLALAQGCVYTLTAPYSGTDGGTGLPTITGSVTIQGNGATISRSTTAGTAAFRIFDVSTAGDLSLSSLTLSNGLADNGQQGGGAIMSHGTLSITGSTFTGDSSPATTGTSGGAINSSGRLTVDTSSFSADSAQEGGGIFNQKIATISQSSFTGNTATIYGGGALLNAAGTMTVAQSTFAGNAGPGGGAIDNDAALKISNSTFVHNSAGSNGGGAIDNFGTTTIQQSTLSGNSSAYGANVLNYAGFKLTLSMSIMANGQLGANCGGEAPVTDGGYNIDTGSSCAFATGNHSMSDTQPQLEALASNGGATDTMALPAGSPAVNAIPATAPGCSGSTDQRGISRPQGPGCDIGAYEVIATSGDTQPPSTPDGLHVTSVGRSSVSLGWNAATDNVAVTGYTVYRNGAAVGSTGGAAATTFTDLTVAPATSYSYTVAAFDGSGNVSPQSQPVTATTSAPSGIQVVQGGSVATGSRTTTTSIVLGQPVAAGDLLVGWFGQYDAAGQVKVADSVNGAWTRAAATTFGGGSGDIALFYLQNSAAAPNGLTITITAAAPTYLQGAAGEYSGIATAGAFDQAVAARGNGTAVDSGATGSVGSGELVVGGIITGGAPGTVAPGSSQGKAFTMVTQDSSGSADLENVLSSNAGTQDARATLRSGTDWYTVGAVFHGYGTGDTQPPTTPTGLAATSVTPSSVSLSWAASTDNVAVSGYTVYRNGVAVGSVTGSSATTYTDSPVSPATTYSYTVDAVDAAGNHSPPSAPLSVTTPGAPPPAPRWMQGGAVTTGTRVASVTIQLSGPVAAGSLLVGWFGQYDASGQVQVSDNVNGAWTRASGSLSFASGSGDLALYYLQNSAAAPTGLTITISAASPTYLQGSAAEYTDIAVTGALDQVSVARGSGTSASSQTGSVPAGELLYSGLMTGSAPGGVAAGTGLTLREHTASYAVDDADMVVSTAGLQDAVWTLQTAADWYEVAAVFRAAPGP